MRLLLKGARTKPDHGCSVNVFFTMCVSLSVPATYFGEEKPPPANMDTALNLTAPKKGSLCFGLSPRRPARVLRMRLRPSPGTAKKNALSARMQKIPAPFSTPECFCIEGICMHPSIPGDSVCNRQLPPFFRLVPRLAGARTRNPTGGPIGGRKFTAAMRPDGDRAGHLTHFCSNRFRILPPHSRSIEPARIGVSGASVSYETIPPLPRKWAHVPDRNRFFITRPAD
jgi:hypothetical protein